MPTREYAFVITVTSTGKYGAQKTVTYADTITWDLRDSRYDAFLDRFNYACAQLGTPPTDTYVLFWSFEPDTLTEEP